MVVFGAPDVVVVVGALVVVVVGPPVVVVVGFDTGSTAPASLIVTAYLTESFVNN